MPQKSKESRKKKSWNGMFLCCLALILQISSGILMYRFGFFVFFWSNDSMLQLSPWGYILFTLTGILWFMMLWSYIVAAFSDPGTLPSFKNETLNIIPEINFYAKNFCHICNNNWKPLRAHHCRICQKCVFKMDHHCIWVNNCIGVRNFKAFALFFCYTLLFSIICELILIACGIREMILLSFKMPRSFKEVDPVGLTISIVYIGIGICVGIFIFVLGQDLLRSIAYNQTSVEEIKFICGRPISFISSLELYFGQKKLCWLVPNYTGSTSNYLEGIYLGDFLSENQSKTSKGPYYEDSQVYKEICNEFYVDNFKKKC